jgi:hypothetical protein
MHPTPTHMSSQVTSYVAEMWSFATLGPWWTDDARVAWFARAQEAIGTQNSRQVWVWCSIIAVSLTTYPDVSNRLLPAT